MWAHAQKGVCVGLAADGRLAVFGNVSFLPVLGHPGNDTIIDP